MAAHVDRLDCPATPARRALLDALEALLPAEEAADGPVNGGAKSVKHKMMTAMQEPKPSSLLF
jgi:hypothetical protein